MNEKSVESLGAGTSPGERACAYRILRYAANLVRDEWVNIGVLVFDPKTGERRLRLIEEQDEYNRVRRLHPQADETLLRALRDDLEDRFQSQAANGSNGGSGNRQQLLGMWDDTLSRHCNWPRKKASLPRTSMPNLSASAPTTSPCSAQRYARFRAGALCHARARRRQAAGLYRGAHRRQGFPENRICRRHRRGFERGE